VEKIKKVLMFEKLNHYLNVLYNVVSQYFPYLAAIASAAVMAGFIYLSDTPTVPYVNQGGSISIIYPSLSDETILEAFAVFLVLILIFVACYILYSYSTKKYFSAPPTTVVTISVFILFILFLVLYIMILPKVSG
jgi:hypothetical protein